MLRDQTHRTTIHGRVLEDPYRWLRERDDRRVLDHLEAENARTDDAIAHTKSLQERLFGEFKARLKETDLSVPVRRDRFLYYTRTVEGQQYPLFCRREAEPEGEELVLLDPNELAKDGEYLRIGVLAMSPDHRILAYSLDRTGSERFELRFRSVESGEDLVDSIPNTSTSLAWAEDNETVFYTVLDETRRPFEIRRHRLGSPSDGDALVLRETDERFFASVEKTKSRAFIIFSVASQITTEQRFLPADRPQDLPTLFAPREDGVEYSIDHHGDHFYFLTNEKALNFRLMRTRMESWDPESWELVIAHDDAIMLEGIELFRDHLVVYARRDGLRSIQIRPFDESDAFWIDFEEPVHTAYGGENPEFESQTLRFHYTSLVTPHTVYDFDMRTRERTLLKQKEVLGGYEPQEYVSRREWAEAKDGERIPISLVHRRGALDAGPAPCLLYAYGSYGISIDPGFSLERLSLLDRGLVFAIAHVRGGGEMGRAWYEQGKLQKKQNTFTDFVACAEHLCARGWTGPDRLAIEGGSAGGLLVGAVLNLRPELFRVAMAHVPFVDVINTMLDDSLPLTVIEYEEWGNPNEREAFEAMLAYSPYDNVRVAAYPEILVTAGLHDPRVQYWEPAKWVARLRERSTGEGLILLKTEMGSGHGGKSGRYDRMRERAFEYAFLLDRLGIGE